MKASIFIPLITAVASLAASISLQAQTAETSKGEPVRTNPVSGSDSRAVPANTTPGATTTANVEGIMRAKGGVHFVKAAKATRLDNELKLSEGITARPDGMVTLKDGKQIQLQDGQMVTLSGELITVGSEPPGIVFASGTMSVNGAVGRPETTTGPNTQGKLDPNDPAGIPGQQSRK
ncbi:MAG TPA: DUF6799 domain-containing protein [Chthoniobacteraceae bacterium]|jgi:hypothetical protein